MGAVSQSAYMAGHMLSALTMGAVSDRCVCKSNPPLHVPFVFTATGVSNGQYVTVEGSTFCFGSVYSSLSRTHCLGPQFAVSDLTVTLAQCDLCLILKLPAAGLLWTLLL